MSEVFSRLESNKKKEVEEAKRRILEQFGNVRDAWLLNGFYEYYLNTNSTNAIFIISNLREPHYNYLFDRISDSIKHSSDTKVQALTLLGHIVRIQPTWLYELGKHHLLKDLLRVLKDEVEVLPVISALLILSVLITMIPYSMKNVIDEVFEIFSRLASWNSNLGRMIVDETLHMQVALYALFLRLYGMFPCNFLAYLRAQYKDKNRPIFDHTIRPMLETVKMNPSLVTTSKDNETTTERWRKMGVHDIVAECERFSLDMTDTTCAHDSCQNSSGFRSRSGTTSNSVLEVSYFLKNFAASRSSNERVEYFSPSTILNPQTPSVGSVAMSTYMPQPEFTHDENIVPQAGSSPPEAAIEATPETTPLIQEEIQYSVTSQVKSIASTSQPQSPVRKEKSPFKFPMDSTMASALTDQEMASVNKSVIPPSGLLKIATTGLGELRSSTIKNHTDLTFKQSDSVLRESEDSTSDTVDEDRSSPCTAGGLHMPNSKSMKNFAERVQRLRHHSQCNPEPEQQQVEPGCELENNKVRRANSCPNMKKSPVSSTKDNLSGTLDETDEDTNDRAESALSNGIDGLSDYGIHRVTTETQTNNLWPMPYEHLFLGIFPSLGVDVTSNSTPLQGSGGTVQDRFIQPTVYEVLDKYIDAIIKDPENGDVNNFKTQLDLVHLHLLFERHRREKHAFKNRRFLAEAKNTQALEEHNSALRDRVQLQQVDIENLQKQLENNKRERDLERTTHAMALTALEDRCKNLERHNKILKDGEIDMLKDIEMTKGKNLTITLEKQKAEAVLLDALVEVKFAKEQAAEGEKGRSELEFVNKQLLLMGELQLKYKERLEELTALRRADQELELLQESSVYESKILNQRLMEKNAKLEAFLNKITELEQLILVKDEAISSQKRTLSIINQETEEKLRSMETKALTQMSIIRCLEEKLINMFGQVELSTRKPISSPDTSSCQEVQVPSDKLSGGTGLSQRSSPLSCSLTSSDGSLALAQFDVKSLQALVDQESPSDIRPDIYIDSEASTSGTKK